MIARNVFRGVGTALITPFGPDGAVDVAALRRLVDYQIEGGIDYIVVLGSTAEAATLSADEQALVRHVVVEQNAGRVPLVLGLGGNNTRAVVDAVHSTDLEPFAAILSVCPFYNKPRQEGLVAHFSAISAACPVPVILYNVPGRTAVNLLPDTVVAIARQNSNVVGIKEASGDVAQIEHLSDLVNSDAALAARGFAVISGDDGLTADLMRRQAVCGVISVLSNAYPEQWTALMHGEMQGLRTYKGEYDSLIDLLFREGNPCGIKALMHLMDLCHNVLRLPLVGASEPLLQDMRQAAAPLLP